MDKKEILRASLLQWRDMYKDPKRDYVFMSKAVDFPSYLIKKLINRCAEFLTSATVQLGDVLKVITWSSASPKELEEVAKVIASWRERLAIPATPASQRRASKRVRMVTAEALLLLAAPVFDSPQTPTNSQPCRSLSPGAGHVRGPQNITQSLSSRPAATSPPQRLLSISQTPSTPLIEEDPFSGLRCPTVHPADSCPAVHPTDSCPAVHPADSCPDDVACLAPT
ncbi:hypothetical protein C8Q72DRAFT_898651 [Fomitopsis betulina]|nr:hypothetical protein C8Q72DRAFT_898651 [Fomitopsis betulina]